MFAERVACTVLCAGALAGSAHGAAPLAAESKGAGQSRSAYYDGKTVEMTYVPGRRDFKIGPWNIFAQVQRDRPRDGHPNLYIVAPGTQYTATGAEEYSHNEILSVVPLKAEPVDWDVYFAVVLDPALHDDFRSEQQLILATQDEFDAPDELKLDELPGATFLKEYLHIDSVDGLNEYRRPDGKLPRLIIVPAKLTVKASAVDPDAPPTENKVTKSIPNSVPNSVPNPRVRVGSAALPR